MTQKRFLFMLLVGLGLLIGYLRLTLMSRGYSAIRHLGTKWMGDSCSTLQVYKTLMKYLSNFYKTVHEIPPHEC